MPRLLLEGRELPLEGPGLLGREERGAIDDASGELGDLERLRGRQGQGERRERREREESGRAQRSTSGATWAFSVVAVKFGRSLFPRSEAPIMLGKRRTTLLYSATLPM